MNLEALKAFRSSDHAVHLRDLLICSLGITDEMYERETSGAATSKDVAVLTALRFLFGESLYDTHEVKNTEQAKALVWLRRQRVGRIIKGDLDSIISDTRYVYETTPANEATRLLLLAYKQTKDILYEKDLGEALCSPKN